MKGLSHLKDFKSIIYKHNGFSTETVKSLKLLLSKDIPYHLEELKLIDLKTSATSELIEALMPRNCL